MVEQILGGEDVFGGEKLRDTGADAADVHDRSIEAGHTQDAKWRMREGTMPREG
jgi:hypothetical protein